MNSTFKAMALFVCLLALTLLFTGTAGAAALQQDPGATPQDPESGKQDPEAGKQDPEAGKTDKGKEPSKLQPLGRGKKGGKGRDKPLKVRKAPKDGKKKAGQVQRMQVSQSGQTRTPNPQVIEDIAAYRKAPLEFITPFDKRLQLDLESVDFDADVVAVINGTEISREEFRMNLVDSLGPLTVDRFITAAVTEIMKKKLIAEGADPAQFTVSEEAVDNDINNQMMLQKQQDRTGQFNKEDWKKMVDQSIGWENFRNLQRSSLSFGMVFVPEIQPKDGEKKEEANASPFEPVVPAGAQPEEKKDEPLDPNLPVGTTKEGKKVNIHMPIHTWNLLDGDDGSLYVRESLNDAYKNGTPLGSFMRPQYIRSVRDAVVKKTDVIYHASGKLGPGVYMKVGETEIMLDEIYPIVAAKVKPEDLPQTLSELLIFKAIDAVLDGGGWTLPDEEFETAFREHEKLYEGSIFSLQFVMNLYGYYLLEDYRKMFRRKLAFQKMLEASGGMTDENLKSFFEGGARLFYQNGGVKVQSIFFGIFDHKAMATRENGFDWAREQMAAAVKELEGGADFLEVARKYENVNGFNRPAENDYMTRNDFRYQFGEKLKYILLEGYCLADDCFYNAKPGDVIGPMKVTRGELGNPVYKGEYLVKVVGYRSMLALNDFEQSRQGIVEDYVDLNFTNWAAKTLAAAEVTLTKKAK